MNCWKYTLKFCGKLEMSSYFVLKSSFKLHLKVIITIKFALILTCSWLEIHSMFQWRKLQLKYNWQQSFQGSLNYFGSNGCWHFPVLRVFFFEWKLETWEWNESKKQSKVLDCSIDKHLESNYPNCDQNNLCILPS